MRKSILVIICLSLLVLLGAAPVKPASPAGITKRSFGKTPEGKQTDLYTVTNRHGLQISITTYGAAIVSLKMPDRAGKLDDIVLGFDDIDGYVVGRGNFGGTMGRVVNRIAHGHLVIDGKTYALTLRDGVHHFHGGTYGFNKVVWEATPVSGEHFQGVQFSYLSKDGEEGYPGNLKVQATFILNDDDELKTEYLATTDKPTVVNLTNHSYYNLQGEGTGDILGHVLTIQADQFTPILPESLPTGEIRDVKGTAFDFNGPHAIGERIDGTEEQLKTGKGYDHNFVLRTKPKGALAPAASLYEPKSGRRIEISTTEPGLQLYTANSFDGSVKGKGGKPYLKHSGICLEPQHFPDSPHHANFPSIVLRPGEQYRSTTIYRFSAM